MNCLSHVWLSGPDMCCDAMDKSTHSSIYALMGTTQATDPPHPHHPDVGFITHPHPVWQVLKFPSGSDTRIVKHTIKWFQYVCKWVAKKSIISIFLNRKVHLVAEGEENMAASLLVGRVMDSISKPGPPRSRCRKLHPPSWGHFFFVHNPWRTKSIDPTRGESLVLSPVRHMWRKDQSKVPLIWSSHHMCYANSNSVVLETMYLKNVVIMTGITRNANVFCCKNTGRRGARFVFAYHSRWG